MSYYKNSELGYLRTLRGGGTGASPESVLEFRFRSQIETVLKASNLMDQSTRLLEVGCGQGAVSLALARKGLECLGVDVAPSAIALAQEMALRLQSPAQFQVANLLQWDLQTANFDVVIDAACLHCLVFDSERRVALQTLWDLLKPEGIFILQSLILSPELQLPAKWRLDKQGILWLEAPSALLPGAVAKENIFWIPQRRLQSMEDLECELHRFRILEAHRLPGGSHGAHWAFIVCQKTS